MTSVQYAAHIAEDDKSRSHYIRELVHSRTSTSTSSDDPTFEIPKLLVQYWHDRDAIPADVKECMESWAPFDDSGFTRILFDDARARTYISQALGADYVAAFDRCHHPAMRSDYLRLCFILLEGGFYVDADEIFQGEDCDHLFSDNCLKLQPFCYDSVRDKMVSLDNFDRQDKSYPEWIFYVNNNPIVSPPGHPIIQMALGRATDILLGSETEGIDIQSTTGPGNLSASLVRHSILSTRNGRDQDFLLLENWQSISYSPWELSYRNDDRNWRLWDPSHEDTRL